MGESLEGERRSLPLLRIERHDVAGDIRTLVEGKARAAREAARALALCGSRTKNDALLQMARGLEEKTAAILDANRADLERARAAGHPRAFLDRLTGTAEHTLDPADGRNLCGGSGGRPIPRRRPSRIGSGDRARHKPPGAAGHRLDCNGEKRQTSRHGASPRSDDRGHL